MDGHPSFVANGFLVHNSGTPIFNYGLEIYNIVNSNLFPSIHEFSREWLSDYRTVSDPKALGDYLKDQCAFIRRTKKDVGISDRVPNKIVQTVGFDQKELDRISDRSKHLAMSLLTEKDFIKRGNSAKELSIMVRKATGISKAKYIAEYVKILLENDEPVLLALWHRDVYEIISKELKEYNPVLYSGSENNTKKDENKELFISGKSKLMMISLKSGAGLDGLQHMCRYLVIGELAWNSASHDQLIGRLDRRGQKSEVTTVFLVSESGSDPVVMDIIGLKSSQFNGIFNEGKAEETKTDKSIIQAYAKKVLESGI